MNSSVYVSCDICGTDKNGVVSMIKRVNWWIPEPFCSSHDLYARIPRDNSCVPRCITPANALYDNRIRHEEKKQEKMAARVQNRVRNIMRRFPLHESPPTPRERLTTNVCRKISYTRTSESTDFWLDKKTKIACAARYSPVPHATHNTSIFPSFIRSLIIFIRIFHPLFTRLF